MLTALAHNDNGRFGRSESSAGLRAAPLTERQRLALLEPLSDIFRGDLGRGVDARGVPAAPSAALRRRHELGICIATSTIAVERDRGPLRWRASVTLWEGAVGRHAAQAEAVARHLARRLLDGVGEGECLLERSGTTFFARKLLSGEEARIVRMFQGPASADLEGEVAALP